MINTAVIIPARLASTRFPRKMLTEVTPGVTLIEHVYYNVCKYHPKDDVYVATDSKEIANLFGLNAIITPESCENGTARVAAAIENQLREYDNFINVQGDMIDLPSDAIFNIKNRLDNHMDDVVTICKQMTEKERQDPNSVKCINNGHTARWFGRGIRNYGDWHLGVYGYQRKALEMYTNLDVYQEEKIESLEQLRWLQNEVKVTITWTKEPAFEINSPEDLITWQSTHQN